MTANEKGNCFHKTSFWKSAVVNGVNMLGRGEMIKLPKGEGKFGGEGRFTRVQELKQKTWLSLVKLCFIYFIFPVLHQSLHAKCRYRF